MLLIAESDLDVLIPGNGKRKRGEKLETRTPRQFGPRELGKSVLLANAKQCNYFFWYILSWEIHRRSQALKILPSNHRVNL